MVFSTLFSIHSSFARKDWYHLPIWSTVTEHYWCNEKHHDRTQSKTENYTKTTAFMLAVNMLAPSCKEHRFFSPSGCKTNIQRWIEKFCLQIYQLNWSDNYLKFVNLGQIWGPRACVLSALKFSWYNSNPAKEIGIQWLKILFLRKKREKTYKVWIAWNNIIPQAFQSENAKVIVTDKAWLRRRIFGREQDVASFFSCSKQWHQYFKSQCPSKRKNPL